MSDTTIPFVNRADVFALPIGTSVMIPGGHPVERCADGSWYMPRVNGPVDTIFTHPGNFPVTVVHRP